MQRHLHHIAAVAALGLGLLLSGCPATPRTAATAGAVRNPNTPALKVTLVCSDLGLGDGSFVREADAELTELGKAGVVDYQKSGDVPAALTVEARDSDIGLPTVNGQPPSEEKLTLAQHDPGTMALVDAGTLVENAPACDLLLLSSASLVSHALDLARQGKLKAKAILLLDQDSWPDRSACQAGPLPVYTFSYDVAPVAFLAGVAASMSSNNATFIALASRADPQAKVWLDAVYAGAKWQSNGTSMITSTINCGPDGLVSVQDYQAAMARIRKTGGKDFACNHYLVALGRATPSVMFGLSKAPTSGYVAGAWADYRQIRPASMIGCALKHPGNAIRWLFGAGAATPGGKAFAASFTAGAKPGITELPVGLAEDCVGFTDYSLYSRYNPDGPDIEKAVGDALGQIKAGELDVHEMIGKYKRLSDEELSR